MSGLMALLVLIGMVFPSHAAFSENAPTVTDSVYSVTDAVYTLPLALAATDKSSALTDLSASITQNGKEITVNDKISHTDPISVSISFGVPVEGDEPTPANPIRKGDTASFKLSKAFTVVTGTSFQLTFGGLPVAHVELVTDANTQEVTANIVFDGDDEVFDGTTGINTVVGRFNAELLYDASGNGGDEGDHSVMILGKTYTVNVPPAEIIYTSSKNGTADLANKRITWEVKVGTTQSGNPIDLKDYTFKDELAQVGEYVPGSFEVNGAPTTPDVTGTELAHTFADPSVGEQIITFQTTIPDEKYYAGGAQSVSNQAQLLNQQDEVVQTPSFRVSFTPEWIEKTGKADNEYINNGSVYDPSNRTITWTITANQMGATLENLTITDPLPQGLEWQSAKWTTGNVDTPVAAGPVGGVYTYPATVVSEKVVLTIVTKVENTDHTTGEITFRNTASVDWTGRTGTTPQDSETVGIGFNAISKSGVVDRDSRQVKWTVNVDTKGQPIPELKVYDLLVYGNSIDLNQVTGIPAGLNQQDLTPRYDQKYAGGFATASGLGSLNVIAIEQGGERVADLLEFSGLSTTVPNSFSFDSLIVNPDIYAGNKTSQVSNTATLFSGTTRLNAGPANVSYNSNLLAKELLTRDAVSDPAAGVNALRTDSASEGFNYFDKSVIFRLSVNADSLDFSSVTNADDVVLGAVTVTDTLPVGWEFTDIEPGKKYLAFESAKSSSRSVQALDTTPDDVQQLNADITGGTATFTFATLDQPYVILVKAKPTDATLENYFDNNKNSSMTNQLNLSAANWSNGVRVNQSVSVASQLVKKSNTIPQAGTLHWTVDYNPYQLQDIGETIEDTLPTGLDLRTDAQGNLLVDGNITAKEMTLKPDGTLEEGAVIPLTLGTNVTYDNQSRVLSFILEDTSKAYRFTYVTDITGESGTVTNHVRLSSGNVDTAVNAVNYAISSADAAATLQRNGWLEITKTDGTTGLSGAEFTLFSEDGSTVIRQGITTANGTLRLKVIPDGKYVLRETVAPVGYTLDSAEHEVIVSTSGSQITTSIDGKTGTGSNLLTVANFVTGTAGNLAIVKTVAGNDGDLNKKFDFTITFNGANGTYSYTGSGGAGNGSLQSGDTVSLAHGEGIEIKGLPKDATYTVTEADYSTEGYATVSSGATGQIVADDTQTVSYTNTKDKPGSLIISKTVAGNAGDQSKKFDFTVTFAGASGTYAYTGIGGAADGTLESGDTVSLAHGESIAIQGLPKDTTYTVTEEDYAKEGYRTTSTGDSGVIRTDEVQTAAFTNTKNIFTSPSNPGGSTPSEPGEPSIPQEPGQPNQEPEETPGIPTIPGTVVPGSPNDDPDENSGETGGEQGNSGGNVSTPDTGNDGQGTEDDELGAGGGDELEKPASPGNQAGQSGNGTPKTGDSLYRGIAQAGLWISLLSLLVWSGAYYLLRSRNRKSVMK